MQIRLLGTAAGGGVPQWNCNCPVCREARAEDRRVEPRTQSSVAVSADGRSWFLLNASPDLRAQIETFLPLQPPSGVTRGSPIQAVLLTNADLDHSLGLLLLREGQKIPVHASAAVRESLTVGISLSQAIAAFCGIEWIEPPFEDQPLRNMDGSESGLAYQAVSLSGRAPRFALPTARQTNHVVGYRIVDRKTGGGLLFLPDVTSLDPGLASRLADCDVLLFDGTFWAEDEMASCGAGSLRASSMGHIPISGAGGSLQVLGRLDVKHKVYVHINNTNPILMEGSPEQAAVLAAGCAVGRDGMEFAI